MKYKELPEDYFHQLRDELECNWKKNYVRLLVDIQGSTGVIYQCLEEMKYHGKYCYPFTYKYRRELAKKYQEIINKQAKHWREIQL